MATVQVIKKTFTNPNTGEIVPYERLAIVGHLNGEPHTLEIKLEKSELGLAKALLSSGKLEIESRPANRDELDEFFEKQQDSGRSSNKIEINEE